MPEEQAYIVFDGGNKPLPWPSGLHGNPTRIYKQQRSGGWEAFLKALETPRLVRGIVIVAQPQSLSIMVGGLKAHFPQTFLDLMKSTLVLLTDEEVGPSQVEPLKRIYGFRTLVLAAWGEEHIVEFIGNIFQAPLEKLPEAPKLENMGATQMADYYQLLGMQRTATQKEINAALGYYREYWSERAQNPETRAKAEYSLALITQAESLLLEPAKRERYDMVLETVRAQPQGRGARGTRRLVNPGTDNVYEAAAWTRDGGFASTREDLRKEDTGSKGKEKTAPDVYQPPAWSREGKEAEVESKPADQSDDVASYRPPSWSRDRDPDALELEETERVRRAIKDELQAESSRDFGDAPILEAIKPKADPNMLIGELRAEAATRSLRMDDVLAEAMNDPELSSLPGLGKRREDPGGEPWPPSDWPPKDWVRRESLLVEDGVPVEEDHAPLAQLEADSSALIDAGAETLPPASHKAVQRRSQLDAPILHRVPAINTDIEVWASTSLALEPEAAFPTEAGYLLGTSFVVGGFHVSVLDATYSLGGEPPPGAIGYYVRTDPTHVAEAAQALESQVGPLTSIDLGLAVDLTGGFGRFFKVGATRRPFPVSPVVRLTNWQLAPPPSGHRALAFLKKNRWSVLAAAGIISLGLFTATLYKALGGALDKDTPPMGALEASSYIRADGVVLNWKGSWEKVAIYRVDAADSTAHWEMLWSLSDQRAEIVDSLPVRRPGRYRYLMVATGSQPRRTMISDVQALDVR